MSARIAIRADEDDPATVTGGDERVDGDGASGSPAELQRGAQALRSAAGERRTDVEDEPVQGPARLTPSCDGVIVIVMGEDVAERFHMRAV